MRLRALPGLLACGFGLASLGAPNAGAAPIQYTITFEPSFTGVLPSGSFTYDAAAPLFTNFVVTWAGLQFDLTDEANTPSVQGALPACYDGSSGAATSFLLLNGCPPFSGSSGPGWSSLHGPGSPVTFGFYWSHILGFSETQPEIPGVPLSLDLAGFTIAPVASPVPEPVTAGLVGAGMCLLSFFSRLRRAA